MEETPAPTDPNTPRTRRKTGTYSAAEPRRDAILDAAVHHFARVGIADASLADIARDAGISKAGLIHHYANKTRLLNAVLARRQRRAIDEFFPPASGGEVGVGPLFAAISRHNAYNLGPDAADATQMFALLAITSSGPANPVQDVVNDSYRKTYAYLSDSLRHAVTSENPDATVDTMAIAREIIAVTDGFVLQWCMSGRTFDAVAALDHYLDRLQKGLAGTSSRS